MRALPHDVTSPGPFMVVAPDPHPPSHAAAFLLKDDITELCVVAGSALVRFDREGRCLAAHALPWAFPYGGRVFAGGRRLLLMGASRAVIVDVDAGTVLQSEDNAVGALSASGRTAAFGPSIARLELRRLALCTVGEPDSRYPPPGTGTGGPLWVNDERDVLVDAFDRVQLYRFRPDVWTTVAERAARGSGGSWRAAADGDRVAYATHSELRIFSVATGAAMGLLRSALTAFAFGPGGLLAGSDHRGGVFLLHAEGERLKRTVVGKVAGGASALAFSHDGRLLAACGRQDPRAVVLSLDAAAV